MNQKAKEEWDKKQAEEAEKFRKLNQVSMVYHCLMNLGICLKQLNRETNDLVC